MLLKNLVKNLPAPAQKRVKALKNLQLEFLKHECTFFEEVYQLERKYQVTYQSIADKRKAIVAGEQEPTEAEATFKSDDEDEDDDDQEMQERLKSIKSLPQYDENVKGKERKACKMSIDNNSEFSRCSRLLVHDFP